MLKLEQIMARRTTAFPFKEGRGSYVYFLFNGNRLIYVGQTETLAQRLGTHTTDKEFDSYAFINVTAYDRSKVERDYIVTLEPELQQWEVKVSKEAAQRRHDPGAINGISREILERAADKAAELIVARLREQRFPDLPLQTEEGRQEATVPMNTKGRHIFGPGCLVRPKEAAGILGVSVGLLYSWVRAGKLVKPRRLSHRVSGWMYEEIREFRDRSEKAEEAQP